MKKIAWASMNVRGRRWLLGTAGLLLTYTLAGFWLVPWVIQDQTPKLAQSALARPASVGAVRFNPYTLRLELQDLALTETDGAPLATLGQLTVDLEWSSLLRRAWTLAEIRLSEPTVNLRIAADGKLNLAQLLATPDKPPQERSASPALPRLIVEQFALEHGKVTLRDDHAGYQNQLAPLNLALAGFSTLPERSGDYTFSATSAQGGTLRWKGSASVNPIRGSGEFVLENVSLPELAVYLPPDAGVSVASGRLSATLPYHFAYAAGKFEAGLDPARLVLNQPGLALGKAGPPLKIDAGEAALQLQLTVEQAASGSNLKISGAAFTLTELSLNRDAQTPLRLAKLGFSDGRLDLAARRASLGLLEAEGGQLQLTRDKQGQLNLLRLLSAFGPADQKSAPTAPPGGTPWTASIAKVAMRQFGADIEDQGTGIKVHVQDAALTLDGASTDLNQAVRFDTSLTVREGGALAAQGSVVPADLTVQSEVRLQRLALAPLQPLLNQYLKLKIAGGSVSAQGQLMSGQAGRQKAALRYVGGFTIAGLALKEENGDLFAGWKSVGTSRLTASLNPNRLDIPELRIVEPNAKLHIDEDRTLNAAQLRARPAAVEPAAPAEAPPAATAAPAAAGPEPFPVRIRRIRLQNGKLDFADLSLLPQFAANIHELNGVVNGLSSRRDARSQIELDGRVEEFGLARIRGELNPFAPSNNTNLKAIFQNVDMVPTSPYTAKFAGYKLAEGKISLDLEYKVRDGQLEGKNQIVMDRLTLGERVDSPSALKLPLELAIAILKDSEGRIDVDLPVSGNVNDPKFSYGALIWKAIGEFIARIVTAPFRALGRLLGISTEELEAVYFDPGSARLLPPEREKLKQVAQMLAQRAQLKLSVPGHYSEAVDGAALRARAVRLAVAQRAGIKLEPGEEPGPTDLADRAVREALRDLYAERFGAAELDQQKKAAEQAAPADAQLPVWRRMGKLLQGEPQVADARPFYGRLQQRLEQTEPLGADALTALGTQRTSVILEALKADGVDPQSAAAAAPEGISAETGKPVPLKLGLTTK